MVVEALPATNAQPVVRFDDKKEPLTATSNAANNATPHIGIVGVSSLAGLTVKLCVTPDTEAYVPLPAWLASTVTVPVPVKVRTFPESVAEPNSSVYVIGRPDELVALSVRVCPSVCALSAGKVTVCGFSATAVK